MDSTIKAGPTNYTAKGRIMFCSVIILFFVVSIMICFHSYARWFLNRRRRRFRRRASDLFSNPVFPITTVGSVSPQGLDLSILNTLPVFIYSNTTSHDTLLECSVCLSEFENEERGRVLPKCNHSFHVECIDAWFQFHSSCPLCRTPVHFHIPVQHLPDTSTETTVITVNEPPVPQRQVDDLGEVEMGSTDSSTQYRFKSPANGMLSLKRICSR
ncbi:hypothetical protein FNV43_RR23564 [Rhamnella rubrinervis]|uniref:RING-type E3 ubiquitin transferase n=1 Tax=Rhamnella rubrinervis TaxID=2594499 RepID=A0A8K0DS90_9ROSA|nr:hypothetical protein FNV43_RR23564 [Rhamnella rubrinervis]